MNLHSQPNNILGDYCDGTAFKESQLFNQSLFYDELNPFGSKAKKQKKSLVRADNPNKNRNLFICTVV